MDMFYDAGLDVMVNTAKNVYPEAADAVDFLADIASAEDNIIVSGVEKVVESVGLGDYGTEAFKFVARSIF